MAPPSQRDKSQANTVVLTSLGLNPCPTSYALDPDGPVHATRFSTVALLALLGEEVRNAHVSVVVSEQVRERGFYEAFAREVEALDLGLELEPIALRPLATKSLEEVVWALEDDVYPGSHLVVDVTQGLRHVQLGLFALALYLWALRPGTRIAGIFYGAHDLKGQSPWPPDVAPLLRLDALPRAIEWHAALRMARDAGNFRAFGKLLNRDVGLAFREATAQPRDLSALRKSLERLTFGLGAGLPLEVGRAATALASNVAAALQHSGSVPLGRLALEALRDSIDGLEFDGGQRGEAGVLDRAELARELRLARRYVAWRREAAAVRILREWLVNWALWRRGETARWLDVEARDDAAHALNVLAERAKANLATEDESRIGSLWRQVSHRRNIVAHGGFTSENTAASADLVGQWIEQADALLDAPWPSGRADAPARGRLLLTPLGLSPGVLYTAIVRLKPTALWVLTSPQGRAMALEAVERTGFDGEVRFVEVDPFAFPKPPWHDDDEARAALHQAIDAASEIVVNITGGTTALQYLVERAAEEAKRLSRAPLRRVALVDRRPPEAQRANPYVLGECIELDRS